MGPPQSALALRAGWANTFARMQLRCYLDTHDITISAFARAIGVGDAAVYKYLSGERYPSRMRLARIAQVTGGQVLPNDFHQFVSVVRCPCENRT